MRVACDVLNVASELYATPRSCNVSGRQIRNRGVSQGSKTGAQPPRTYVGTSRLRRKEAGISLIHFYTHRNLSLLLLSHLRYKPFFTID
jgi:hypothetical protein